ncbi:MAG: CRISPR-associated endonuclease Cas1 [bacterium]
MRNVYIISNGTLIRKNNTIYFESKVKSFSLPVKAISNIHIFGEINLNKRLLEFISKNNINIFFYSRSNKYIGSFSTPIDIRGDSTIKQVESYLDPEIRFEIAKSIVVTASKNMLNNLRYYNKSINSHIIKKAINQIKLKITRLNTLKKLPSLMAYEGRIRQDYYACFDEIIKNKNFIFDKRSYHPPKNIVNAMISLFNTLLYNYITSLIHELKLNVSISYLHTSNRRTESLNLDIAEIYKPILVDRFVFRIINKRMIKLEDFNSNFHLDSSTLKSLIFDFDKIFYKSQKVKDKRLTYTTIIKKDILNLKNFISKKTQLNFFKKRDK